MSRVPRHPLDWIDDALRELDVRHLRRRLRTRAGAQSARVALDGRELVNFGSNDYLGLAGDPRLGRAVVAAIAEEGWGSGASPLIAGRSRWHARLETRLAEFEDTEAALVFSSGFAANTGTIAALAGPGDVVLADQLNHASLIDGCRLSRAEVRVYPHGDMAQLAAMLEASGAARRRVIVSDSLFSMEGDLAPLATLADLAERFEAMLVLDEAHATGVFGPHGRGVSETLGPAARHRVHVRIGTLSKALGCAGGFVCGRASLIDWLANRARPYVFSTAAPGAASAAAVAALDLVEQEPFRRAELLARARRLCEQLRLQGWDTGNSASQIIPLFVGDEAQALALAEALRERGLFVPAIRPPSVPRGRSLLRISLSYAHTDAMLEQLVTALGECRPPSAGGA